MTTNLAIYPLRLYTLSRPLSRIAYSTIRYASSTGKSSDDLAANASEILKDAQQQARVRMPGPFPDGVYASGGDRPTAFRELGLGGKLLRSTKNLGTASFVIIFGVCLTGGIVYAISTELLASAAPTRIFNAAIPYVQDNDEISSLFRQPYSYHGEGQGGRKHRKIQSTIRTNPQTGREEQVVRFVLQAHIKDDPNESYWSKLKRWLRPIIVEPSLDRQTPQQQPLAAAVKQAEPKSWFETIFHAFIPPKEPVRTSLSRGFTKRRPHLGEFSTGTVVCTMLRLPSGAFEFSTITVDIPTSRDPAWKVQVLRKTDEEVMADAQAKEDNKLYNRAKAYLASS